MNPCLSPAVSGRYLSFVEREEIALLRAQKVGVREIARRIGRSPSTISRELRRNASARTYHLTYKASTAQWHAERRSRRPKVAKLVGDERLHQYVQARLFGAVNAADGRTALGPPGAGVERAEQATPWRSPLGARMEPEQISNRIKVDYRDDESMRISHEAIY